MGIALSGEGGFSVNTRSLSRRLILAVALLLALPAQAKRGPQRVRSLPAVDKLNLKIQHDNPTYNKLLRLAKPRSKASGYNSRVFRSNHMRRWPVHTVQDDQVTPADRKALGRAIKSLEGQKLVQTYGKLGKGADARLVRMIAPEKHAQLGVFSDILFPRVTKGQINKRQWAQKGTFTTVFVPDYGHKPRVLVDTDKRIAYVLGSNYFGERKKSALRMWWYEMKQNKGAIPLHASAMTVKLKDGKTGKTKEHRTVVLGHSGTGKSTLSTSTEGLNLRRGEQVISHQDDAGALVPVRGGRWRFVGTEHGMFLKTDGVTKKSDPGAWEGMTSRKGRTAFENVVVTKGKADFLDNSVTKNSRAAVDRQQISMSRGQKVHMGQPNSIVMISRHELVPAIARVPASRPEKGAFAYALGESVKTSAAGGSGRQVIRETAFSSFITGPPATEANRMLDFLKQQSRKKNGTRAFIMNTGSVMTANGPVKVRKTDSLRLLRAMQRGKIEWKLDKNLGLEVPAKVQGMSQAELDRITVGRGMQPAQYKRMLNQVRSERVAHLKTNVPGLNPSIMEKGVY
jgi:phosphoenolpyruvate carboxykinase (ATP)